MGFWSSIGSFVSSAIDTVSSAASSVVSTVKDATSAVWNGAKRVAQKVIDTAVDVGGKIVGTVKEVYHNVKQKVVEVYEKVKPYITKAKVVVSVAGNYLATIFPQYPWIKSATNTIVKGLTFLENLDKNPLVKKVTEAIEWALDTADKWIKKIQAARDLLFTSQQEKEAVQRQQDLQEAMSLMKTEEQKKSIRFAMLINQYMLIKTRIERALEDFEISESTNFDHYLRLRATQRLLKVTERRMQRADNLSQISDDDLFLISTGADLLAEKPTLSTEDAIRLDKIIKRRFNGKALLPFVFEELIFSWNTRMDSMNATWERLNKQLSGKKRALKQLKIKQKIEELTFKEQVDLGVLEEEVRELGYELTAQEVKNREMQNYIYAAEGFLQVLEKTEEQFIAEEREWIIEDSSEVGMLLINTVERDVPWNDLTEEQQSLINDFANIFAEDSKRRQAEMVAEIEDDIKQEIEVTA